MVNVFGLNIMDNFALTGIEGMNTGEIRFIMNVFCKAIRHNDRHSHMSRQRS